MNKELSWSHSITDHGIALSFFLASYKNVVVTLGEGYATSVCGKLSYPFTFAISYSTDPLTLMLSYRHSSYRRLIYVDYVFSMTVPIPGLINFIHVDNGVADALTFDGRSGSFSVSPKNNSNMTVTFHNCS